MNGNPISKNCDLIFSKREHVCFGVSPFNSYFSESKIRELAKWGKDNFKSMHFFIPDVPAIYTLEALGYDKEKAEWKARRQAQYLKNKIHRALNDLFFSMDSAEEMILDWEKLETNQHYQDLSKQAHNLFENDSSFRNECFEASRWVMENKVQDVSVLTEEVLCHAVKYFLAEIPLFANAAGILSQSSSVFCYHQKIHFLEKFYQRELSLKPFAGQGFLVFQDSASKLNEQAADM